MLLWVIPVVLYSQQDQATQQLLEQCYGYFKSHELLAQKVKRSYPELELRTSHADHIFQSNFANALKSIDQQIRNKHQHEYPKISKKLIDLSSSSFKNLTKEEARKFLFTYEQMGRGIIKSPYLEVLLAHQYNSTPLLHYFERYHRQYEVSNYSKDKLIEISLNIPNNWVEQTHKGHLAVLKKFRSNLGNGNVILNLVKVDQSDKHLIDHAPDKFLAKIIPNSARIMASERKLLNGQNAFVVNYLDRQVNLNTKFKRNVSLYLITTENEIILIDFSVYLKNEEKNTITAELKSLFDHIARTVKISIRPYNSSLVINKQ